MFVKIKAWGSWGELRSDCLNPKKHLVSFIIIEILFYLAAATKNIFLCKKWCKIGALFSDPKVLQSLDFTKWGLTMPFP